MPDPAVDWPRFYILDERGEPQRVEGALAWAAWAETADRHVAQDMDEGEGADRVRVSTIFLGFDHGHSEGGPPVLWETMVFGGALDRWQWRYTSLADAWQGHQAVCQQVRDARGTRP